MANPAPGFPSSPGLNGGGPFVPILSETDPGNGAAPKQWWIVPSTAATYVRNAAGTAWITISGGTGSVPTLAAILAASNDADSNAITNLADPSDPQDAATMAYVDLAVALGIGSITPRIVAIATPGYYTGGDITCNQTTWGELAAETGGPGTGGFDIDFTGLVAGDMVEVSVSAQYSGASVGVQLDMATIVSGSPVSYFGAVTGASSGSGVAAWSGPNTGSGAYSGGTAIKALSSGDLTADALKLRPWFRTGSATDRTLYASANNPFQVAAKVYRAA